MANRRQKKGFLQLEFPGVFFFTLRVHLQPRSLTEVQYVTTPALVCFGGKWRPVLSFEQKAGGMVLIRTTPGRGLAFAATLCGLLCGLFACLWSALLRSSSRLPTRLQRAKYIYSQAPDVEKAQKRKNAQSLRPCSRPEICIPVIAAKEYVGSLSLVLMVFSNFRSVAAKP
eukprot:331440-Prorocentrum_minimum.AAC.2